MRPRGGIIGANVTPTQSAASGVWTLREAEAYARAGTWPTFPGAPTGVSGSAGVAQVSLTWTAPSANGGYSITDYVIQYSSNSGSTWTTFNGRTASATASQVVTGLTNGTAYVFRVAAKTALGTGAYSTQSASVTPVNTQTTTLTSGGGNNSWRWQADGYVDATASSGSQFIVGNVDGYTAASSGWRTTWSVSPKPSSVASATLTFPTGSVAGAAFSIVIRGCAADNAGTLLTGGSQTSASVSVTRPSSGNLVADVTSIVNEIIGRSGWVSGNSLVFYLLPSGPGADCDWRMTSDTAGSLTITW